MQEERRAEERTEYNLNQIVHQDFEASLNHVINTLTRLAYFLFSCLSVTGLQNSFPNRLIYFLLLKVAEVIYKHTGEEGGTRREKNSHPLLHL